METEDGEKEDKSMEHTMPKMVKYVKDDCYGQTFVNSAEPCIRCWIRHSCESNYKANIKKLKSTGKKPKIKEKKYKKTDKYREWF